MNGAIGGEWGLVPPQIRVRKITAREVKCCCSIVWQTQGIDCFILKNRLGMPLSLMGSLVSAYPVAILNDVEGLVALNKVAIKMFEERFPNARIIYA